MNRTQNLVWIDLEMTGLDPVTDHILEVTMVLTDGNLRVLREGMSFVIHQPESVLGNMNLWCQESHGRSGLIDAVRSSTTTVEYAQEQLLDVIKEYCDVHTGILAGNSIWQDRAFLVRYMPLIVDYLHYRLLDVTAIKEVVMRWYPDDPNAYFKKTDVHRSLVDIQESIAELAHYREHFFKR